MLKHKEILDRLSKLEKTSLVASALSAEPFERAGIPPVKMTSLLEKSCFSVARSWDPQLFGRLTKEFIAQVGCKNNLFVTPDLKTAVDPYSVGLSEDATLSGAFGAQMIRASHSVGAAVGVKKPSLDENDIAYVDASEDYAAVHELFVKPFVSAVENDPCDAVIIDPSHSQAGYYDTNRTLLSEVQNGLLGEDVFIVGEGETFTADAVNMLGKNLTLGGCTIPLERAVRRYAQLKVYEEEGSIPHREIEESLRNGNAIDDERLDEIVDSIIDFALTIDGLEYIESEEPAYENEQEDKQSDVTSEVENASAPNNESQDDAQAKSESEEKNIESENNDVPASGENADVRSASEETANNREEGQADISAEKAPVASFEENQADNIEHAQADNAEENKENSAEEGQTSEDNAENQSGSGIDVAKTNDIADNETSTQSEGDEQSYATDTEYFEPQEPVLKTAAAESVVLLKNRKRLLPLSMGAKVAIIGEQYEDMSAFRSKFNVVGNAKGYDRAAQRSDTLIPAAVRSTKNAEAVIVFLHPDENGKLALPANRLALLDALKNARKRVIALVVGDRLVDMSFDSAVDSLLLVPADCPYAGEALAELLVGERVPSGRLTRTYYDNADEYFKRLKEQKDSKAIKIGSFVGYRRSSIENVKVRYPFGFGLNYTSFKYSSLELSKDRVSFTLQNTGDMNGWAVPQIYVGVPTVTRVAPKMQLRAFSRVFLKKGESKRVTITLGPSTFESYDPSMYTDSVETGEYTVYVASSSVNVRLEGKLSVKGVTRQKDKYTRADFTQDGDYGEVSKVRSEGRVAKSTNDLPKNLKLLRKIAIYAVPTLTLLFFVMLSVFIMSYALDYFMLTTAGQEVVEQFVFLSAVFVIVLTPLLGSMNRKRIVKMRNVALVLTPVLIFCLVIYAVMFYDGGEHIKEFGLKALTYITIAVPVLAVITMLIDRQLWRDKKGKNRWDKYYFERLSGDKTTSDAEFDEAMRAAEAAKEAKISRQPEEAPAVVTEVPQFYDKRLTYSQMLADCKQFLAEGGLDVDEEDLVDYIAALSSTQLLFVPKGGGADICEAVSEYFGKKAYVMSAENYLRYDDLFYEWSSKGYASVPTNFTVALDKAVKETAYLHTVLVRHIDKNALETLFAPLAEVIARHKITFKVGEKSEYLPQNLFIVAEIEEEKVELPEKLAQVAAVLSPKFVECEAAERRTIVQTVGFERINAMQRHVRDDHPLGEEQWKKVDALDERMSSANIANNIWNRMEMHSSIAVACGESQDDAIDRAMATELIAWLSVVWQSEDGVELKDAMLEIFADNKLEACMKSLLKEGEENDQL